MDTQAQTLKDFDLDKHFPRSIWQPEIHKCDWYSIDTEQGIFFVMACDLPENPQPEDFQDYVEGRVQEDDEIELLKDHYGFRMQMPGCMDSTDWCVCETEASLLEFLIDYHSEADWSEGLCDDDDEDNDD